MKTEKPDPAPAAAALAARWCDRIAAAKAHHRPAFERMRRDMAFARLGADPDWIAGGAYVANVVQRHVAQKVSALYAKNPRALARRRPRLEHALWNGDPHALARALELVAAEEAGDGAASPPGPLAGFPGLPADAAAARALIADIEGAAGRRAMLDRLAETLEILFHYYLDEQQPGFKQQAKQLVRRTVVCGVGYVKLGFQRLMEPRPDTAARIEDASRRLAAIERLEGDLATGEIAADSPEAAELAAMLAALQAEPGMIAREGLVFDFPRPTEIIVDPKCRQLRGFVGADWIAHEMTMTAEEVEEVYGCDIGGRFTPYAPVDAPLPAMGIGGRAEAERLALVWEVYDRRTGLGLTVADGHPGYLREPAPPDVALERFFPVFALGFNEVEDEGVLYPPSDVTLLRPMQEEYNRSRQGLREHRQANRPKYVTSRGRLEEEDKALLVAHPHSAVLELNALQVGERVGDLLQRMEMIPIDGALYDTGPVFEDVLRTVGAQEANLGGTSGATATESSIAEGSRISSVSSEIDQLDDLLSELARAAGIVMLRELRAETVRRIVGPGAVWPEWSRAELAEELFLEIRAGSSGRPNRAAELANLERVAPTILQIPGISPAWLARQVLERLDDALDIEEAIVDHLPSVAAMNAAARKQEAPPGPQGPQPAFPPPVG